MTPAKRRRSMAEHGLLPPRSYLNAHAQTKLLFWRALAAGETFHKHSAAARFGWHESTAADNIKELHAAKLAHIVGWTRNGSRGPMTPVIAFGPGDDAPRPAKLANKFVCKRWRERHPEQAEASWRHGRLVKAVKNGSLPKGNDPLLFAIMGIAP